MSGFLISRNSDAIYDLRRITGGNNSSRALILLTASGVVTGIILSSWYRLYLGIDSFPKSIHFFAVIAALIGSTEELVFRGFIQGQVKKINGPLSVLFSTVAHTGYKCCLFLSPMVAGNIDVSFLGFFTFSAGLVFGSIRYFTGSLIPSLIAHALFDIMVYAEYVSAPWWVW